MSTAITSGALQRLGVMQSELEGVDTLAEAYTLIAGEKPTPARSRAYDYNKYNFEHGNVEALPPDYAKAYAVVQAQITLKQLLKEIEDLNASVLSEDISTSGETEAASGVQQDAQKTE